MSEEQQQQQPLVERIDGRPYIHGTQEHHDAIEAGIEWRRRKLQESHLTERFDANETAFLARDLLYVQRDVQKILYEKLRAAEFVPVRSETPRGAETWAYRQMDMAGEALAGAELSADDAPNVDVAIEEFDHKVSNVTASYQYTIEDLEKAAFSGTPLDRMKAEACAETIARKLDELMRVGDSAQGITGFFNNPNVPVLTLTNGEWDSTATVDEIIADWGEIEQTIIDQSRDVHRARRLILPSTMEKALREARTGTDSDVRLSTFLTQDSRMIREIERWFQLDGFTGGTIADPPLGIAYEPDPELVHAEIPVPYEELPPEVRGFAWVVNARAIFGGVVFKRPLSALYIENLD